MTTRQQATRRPQPIERNPGELASEVLDDLLDALRQRRGDLAAEMADELRKMISLDGYAPPWGLSRYATTTFAHAAAGVATYLPGGEFGPVIPKGEPAEGDELPGPLAILAACEVGEGETLAHDHSLSPANRRAALRAARRGAARRAQLRDAADLAEYVELPPLDDGDEFPGPTDDEITEAADVFADLTGHYTDGEATA